MSGVHGSEGLESARLGFRDRRLPLPFGTSFRAAHPVSRSLIHFAVISKLVALATILMVATGCDKAKDFVRAGQTAGPPQLSPGEELDLASKPDVLFQVFGESSDPRMVPIAAIVRGTLKPIRLSASGWHKFDAMYQSSGKSYSLYQSGIVNGTVDVKRGMWSDTSDALYALPGCATLTPMASVKVNGRLASDFTLEFLASSAAAMGKPRGGAAMNQDSINRIARGIARNVATSVGIKEAKLDSLNFRALAFYTGASSSPTIIASYIDASAEHPASIATRTTHLVVIVDKDSSGTYRATFSHRINGPLAAAAFRRYFDHLDIDGDGVDEIVLQGWQFGGDTFLSVLGWRENKWQEIYRTRANWCLDERKAAN
ncbi:MAG: hypothetical protein JWO39_2758 [Gemmatimonadetes bacterium]|nr:hypothetical protein [Gemmatimonadota bacterium]